jgi:hypothetical protein
MTTKPLDVKLADGETMQIKLPLHIYNKGYEKEQK